MTLTISYQWQRRSPEESEWEDIDGATSPNYRSVDDDIGLLLALVESATNSGGTSTVRSNPVGPITPEGVARE